MAGAIIYLNEDTHSSILDYIRYQLLIHEVLTYSEFINNVNNTPDYIALLKGANKRIIVKKDPLLNENKDLADCILFFKNGLVSIEKSGLPVTTFQLNNLNIHQLLYTNYH